MKLWLCKNAKETSTPFCTFKHNRSANKNVEFFPKSWHWHVWPSYSDLSRSIFFDSPWSPKIWLWKVTVRRSNKPMLPFREKFDIFICRSVTWRTKKVFTLEGCNTHEKHAVSRHDPILHIEAIWCAHGCFQAFKSITWLIPSHVFLPVVWVKINKVQYSSFFSPGSRQKQSIYCYQQMADWTGNQILHEVMHEPCEVC